MMLSLAQSPKLNAIPNGKYSIKVVGDRTFVFGDRMLRTEKGLQSELMFSV